MSENEIKLYGSMEIPGVGSWVCIRNGGECGPVKKVLGEGAEVEIAKDEYVSVEFRNIVSGKNSETSTMKTGTDQKSKEPEQIVGAIVYGLINLFKLAGVR